MAVFKNGIFAYDNGKPVTPQSLGISLAGIQTCQQYFASSSVSTNTQKYALYTLVGDLETYGIWNKVKVLYPFITSKKNIASYTEASTTGYTTSGVSLTSTTQESPIGTNTAVRVTYVSGGYIFQRHALLPNTQYTYSVYLRAVSGTPTVNFHVNYNNGSNDAATQNITLSTVWTRYSITFNSLNYVNDFYNVVRGIPADIEFWGWQLELGAAATSYEPTLGAFSNFIRTNLKDPSTFNGTFFGFIAYSPLGIASNGTSGYINTTFNPTSSLTYGSTHMAVYMTSGSVSATDIAEIGYVKSGGGSDMILDVTGNSGKITSTAYSIYNQVTASNASNIPAFYLQNVTASLFHGTYKNSTLVSSKNTLSGTLPNGNLYIGGVNNNGSSTINYSKNRLGLISIGDGLTDTEAANFYTAVQRFQTTLGRQV
jgi:hypothetical protein